MIIITDKMAQCMHDISTCIILVSGQITSNKLPELLASSFVLATAMGYHWVDACITGHRGRCNK
jgi:hypothetical protein